MKKGLKAMLICAVGLAAGLSLTGCAAREQAEPSVGLCYRVTGGKNEMVILGSIHVGNEEMNRFGTHITDAMSAADTFVFECDNDSADAKKDIQELTAALTPLCELISPEAYAMLGEVCEKQGYSLERFDAMRPWAVISTLSTQTAAAELGVKNAAKALSMGVESTVRSHARGKSLVYLETAREQLSILDGFSPALQDAMLKSACELILHPKETSLDEWPAWWRDGDAEKFAAAYGEENDLTDASLAKEYHDRLVTERNQKMARRLQALLEGGEAHSYFVTVGLLHLALPDDSVLRELEALGYGVERMTR